MKNGLVGLIAQGADKLMPYLLNPDLKKDPLIKLVYEVALRKMDMLDEDLEEHSYLAAAMVGAMDGYIFRYRKGQDIDDLVDALREFYNIKDSRTRANVRKLTYKGGRLFKEGINEVRNVA